MYVMFFLLINRFILYILCIWQFTLKGQLLYNIVDRIPVLYERTLFAAPEHSRELLRELFSSLTRLPYSLLPSLSQLHSEHSDHSCCKHICRPIDTIMISHDRAMEMRKKQLEVATRIAKIEPENVDAQLL